MPHDIFISYSSKDKEKANQLSELLASAGLSVWIDQTGIGAATSWSEEIVNALDSCKAFIVILSPFSIESKNVVREVALAFEKNKKILPLDLEPAVQLPASMQYHLAGLQRTAMTNTDAIIRALEKLGLEATKAPTLKLVKETDSRKSLMILPFDDLSPTADNQWFADGIVTELIGALSNVKALRVTDPQATREFKAYKGHLSVYAKEMSIRYFVQGSVRKMGDQLKIMAHVLDIETGDYLWQDSLKGTMEDIFDIQETVAKKVMDGLNIILTKEEEKKVTKKPTENAEAYELYLKGIEYWDRFTQADFERALGLNEEAILLDPNFVVAHISIANISLQYYRTYSRESKWVTRAQKHIEKAESVLGRSKLVYWIRSSLANILGNYEAALLFAKQANELDPEYGQAYDALGSAYLALGRKEEAVDAWKRGVQLMDPDRNAHFNYILALNELNDTSRLAEATHKALPVYERYLRLTPDNLSAWAEYALLLAYANEHERALFEARKLEGMKGLEGSALYNVACLFLREGENESGLSALRKSVEQGFRNIEDYRRDPDLNPLRGMKEFKDLMKELEEKIAIENNG